MIFGFLFLDILLWAVFPLVLLCLLWGDQKGWATFLAFVVGLIVVSSTGFGAAWALLTDPVWISNALRNLCMYLGGGFLFSFLKWWVIANKSAKAFSAFLPAAARRLGGDVKPDALADAWNKRSMTESYDNKYYNILSVVPKDGGGWTTKYAKLNLGGYVMSWTVYWPLYMMLLVLDDLLRHVFDWLVEVFGKGFQKIADGAFAKIS